MQEYFSNKTIEKLKYDLVREHMLSFEDLSRAEEISAQKNLNLGQILVNENMIPEEILLKFLEDNLHIPCIHLEDYSLDKQCLKFISAEDAKKHKIIPLFRIEDVLTIAMADPLNLFVLNNLVKSVNCKIEPVICSERLILEAIEKLYYSNNSTKDTLNKNAAFDWRDELSSGIINEFQAEKVINAIIFQAFSEDVSEIILENTNEGKLIKFKANGIINEKGAIPVLLTPLFNAKLKSMSGIDSAANEIPQLGKFNIKFSGENISSVIATFPTVKGERITIKLYRPPESIKSISISEENRNYLKEILNKPGIILIAGPELSGKSFIAYSILNSIQKTNKNIMTVESIAKYDLTGVIQCELKEKAGFNLKKAINFINFQTPDVVYIEEIIPNSDIKYLSMLANTQKTVITEILAENTENLQNILSLEYFKEFKKNINCLIFVENKDKIQIIKTIDNINSK